MDNEDDSKVENTESQTLPPGTASQPREPQRATPVTESQPTSVNAFEEERESEHEMMKPKILMISDAEVNACNGKYFLVKDDGLNGTWAKEGWRVTMNEETRQWLLISPNDEVVGRTMKSFKRPLPPIGTKWWLRQGVGASKLYKISALEITRVIVYRKGEEVLAKCGISWYFATVSIVHENSTVDLRWRNEPHLKSSNVPLSRLRKNKRLTVRLRLEGFETERSLARLVIPLEWWVKDLRDFIGRETLENLESIKLYTDDGKELPNQTQLESLDLCNDVWLRAKKEKPDIVEKGKPLGFWWKGDSCEVFCEDMQWRQGIVSNIVKDQCGLTAEVVIDEEGKSISIPVFLWHERLRIPQPEGVPTCARPPFREGMKVMVSLDSGERRQGTITSRSEDNNWMVIFDGENQECNQTFRMDQLAEVAHYQNMLGAMNILPDYSACQDPALRVAEVIDQIHECKDADMLSAVLQTILEDVSAKNDVSVQLLAIFNRFRRQIDNGSIFPQKVELCIHLAKLLPPQELSEMVQLDTKNLLPIPDPENEGQFSKGARLSKNICWDVDGPADDVTIPLGSRLVEICEENVQNLAFEDVIKKIMHDSYPVVKVKFNISGTTEGMRKYRQSLDRNLRKDSGRFGDTNESYSTNHVEPPPPSNELLECVEQFVISDTVWFLDGEDVRMAKIIDHEGDNTYLIAFIEEDKNVSPRQVPGSLLSQDPNSLKERQNDQQLHPAKVNIHSVVAKIQGYLSEFRKPQPIEEVRNLLKREFRGHDFEKLLKGSLEDFFNREDQYQVIQGDEKSFPRVQYLCMQQFIGDEKELHWREKVSRAFQNGGLGGHQDVEIDMEVTSEQLAQVRETAQIMGIFPSDDQIRQAILSQDHLNEQINYLLELTLN